MNIGISEKAQGSHPTLTAWLAGAGIDSQLIDPADTTVRQTQRILHVTEIGLARQHDILIDFADGTPVLRRAKIGRPTTLVFGFEDMAFGHALIAELIRPAVMPACGEPDSAKFLQLAARIARSEASVLLLGQTGTGKEGVARFIHAASGRAERPFVAVNCGAIPDNLVESILFGHEKGAFTGATERHTGKFMEADGGTLFLDEIGDLPLDVQVKLLRAVQQGEIETVGAGKVQKVDVRLISATNKDLIEEVRAGRFREDLYYRLNVFPITIPALRRRKEDIPHLARVFTERFSAEQKLERTLQVGASAMALLTAYDWPGNIRQLENAVFRAVVLAEGPDLTEKDFPQIAAQVPDYQSHELLATAVVPVEETESQEDAEQRSMSDMLRVARAEAARSLQMFGGPENVIVSTDDSGDVRKLADVEEELIRFALKFYRGQMSQVARKLGIGRSTLYRKLKDYGIDPDDPLKEAA